MSEYEVYWLPQGTILNQKYRIDNVIEEGGMGIVYRAFDLVLNIPVSIKEYFPRRFAMRDTECKEVHVYKGIAERHFSTGLDKFIREARLLAQFQNVDSIVLVQDFFYENNTAYIIMEYVPGDNAKQRVAKEGKLNPEEVLGFMRPILLSLNEIHKTGLIHRDISPDNIVFREDDKAVLIDFGAARFSEMNENKTMTIFFKRGYSAEEQYVEKAAKGAYTDVYAVCATMYFMLTGIQPSESVARLVHDTTVPLTKFKDVALNIQAKEAITKGMSVQAKERFQTVEELCRALYGDEIFPQSVRKHKKRIWIAGILTLIILLSGICWSVSRGWKIQSEGDDLSQRVEEHLTEQQVTPPAVVVVSESGVSAEVKKKKQEYIIPNVKNMKKKNAIKRIQKNGDSQLTIKIKKVYSSKVKKGRVVNQSIPAGAIYTNEETQSITLRVSKGKNPNAEKRENKTEISQKSKKTTNTNEFAGELPW